MLYLTLNVHIFAPYFSHINIWKILIIHSVLYMRLFSSGDEIKEKILQWEKSLRWKFMSSCLLLYFCMAFTQNLKNKKNFFVFIDEREKCVNTQWILKKRIKFWHARRILLFAEEILKYHCTMYVSKGSLYRLILGIYLVMCKK